MRELKIAIFNFSRDVPGELLKEIEREGLKELSAHRVWQVLHQFFNFVTEMKGGKGSGCSTHSSWGREGKGRHACRIGHITHGLLSGQGRGAVGVSLGDRSRQLSKHPTDSLTDCFLRASGVLLTGQGSTLLNATPTSAQELVSGKYIFRDRSGNGLTLTRLVSVTLIAAKPCRTLGACSYSCCTYTPG